MSGQWRRGQRPPAWQHRAGHHRVWPAAAPTASGQFGATRDAFLASLAPLVAFPLVGGVLMLLGGGGLTRAVGPAGDAVRVAGAAGAVLRSRAAVGPGGRPGCASPPRSTGASGSSRWSASLLLMVLGILAALGLPRPLRAPGVVLGLVSYGLWLHWFLARHGLGLSRHAGGGCWCSG